MSVKIAIIDSGINSSHSHVGETALCETILLDESGNVIVKPGGEDEIGHGTAVAGVIRQYAPQASLHALKIFHDRLNAPMAFLLQALKRALEKDARIIHLSLGTDQNRFRGSLQKLSYTAQKQNAVMISSARSADDTVLPAAFPNVIGVYHFPNCPADSLVHHPESPIQFGAHGFPRPLPGIPQESNFRGNSFAAAHVSGRVAALLEKNPDMGLDQILESLANQSLTTVNQPT